MAAPKPFVYYAAHMAAVVLMLAGSCAVLSAPGRAMAQEYPVSVVEPGKTPGFQPPVLYLNRCIASRRLLPKLRHNRTLHEPFLINTDPDLGEVDAPIDHRFMVKMIFREVKAFNQYADPYDDPERPSPGYAWQLKIFHPGSSPGTLPAEGAPYPVIVFCIGASGSIPSLYDAMDWLGNYYARRGYIVAIPVFIGNDEGLTGTPFYEITPDIFSLQVSQAIDYIRASFGGQACRYRAGDAHRPFLWRVCGPEDGGAGPPHCTAVPLVGGFRLLSSTGPAFSLIP